VLLPLEYEVLQPFLMSLMVRVLHQTRNPKSETQNPSPKPDSLSGESPEKGVRVLQPFQISLVLRFNAGVGV